MTWADLHPLDLRSVSVARALREVRDAVQVLASQTGLTVFIVSRTTRDVLADSRRLHQVLLNLLSNAVKFSPAGATIQTQAEDMGDFVRFSVTDEGPGIDERCAHACSSRSCRVRATW